MVRRKIAFFSKGNDSFIKDIIERLSIQYDTQRITIETPKNNKLIEQGMEWADVCWFEWCDDLLSYASRLSIAKEKKIICRLHSYEAFSLFPAQINWDCVDRLIFVSEDICRYVLAHFNVDKNITLVIPNGVDLDKWTWEKRGSGFNVAYVGYINYKKGPMLLLHTMKAIHMQDDRYKFYIAGQFQDPRFWLYFEHMIKEFKLENAIFFEGWQRNLNKWLENKNYILCTSVLESQNMSVMQAMAKGIKPVVHNFVGAKNIYKGKYLWNTIYEAVCKITESDYNSNEYREFITNNYSLEIQMKAIDEMIRDLIYSGENENDFDYKRYWNNRLNLYFNIEGAGYLGLGEIYNELLYRNRISLLEGVVNKAFGDIRNKRVLELGPGIGIFTEFFNNMGVQRYEGIDIALKSVDDLQKRYRSYQFKHGDICDDSFYDGEYDLIFSADVLMHITNENHYGKAINNISKHLSTGGLCILLDPISVINAKSESPHVIIRDRKYVEQGIGKNALRLTEMLPVTYFMNYPFDREIIGSNASNALNIFNFIHDVFMDSTISDEDKRIIGEYILYRDRKLLYTNEAGLSEKLLIIQKENGKLDFNIKISEIFDIKSIDNEIDAINKNFTENETKQRDALEKLTALINCF
ncbi:glycosyl transferase family 1 [Ruminiclostridium sufflavum DSM 19573]|uniref:Glycosyl transferase family 1 n=1 Tax=Ruminiclostridium sufflavum DSM 19573 TaxID=1121337 RepID=A0A318XL14_9FIRM|nr:methyltransferase domain-containing protein [Ruminiclostridium sufflavum]PYG85784.1 glycosyl transferase family 1 [Ruminiclostridium sufflavum DSM 19573]